LIHSFVQYLFSGYHVPGTALGTKNTAVNKAVKIPVCNPIYLRSGDQEDHGLRPAQTVHKTPSQAIAGCNRFTCYPSREEANIGKIIVPGQPRQKK
jgi:hypothetical protein